MSNEDAMTRRGARLVVIGNEKGGSGKSTVAMHVAVALLKARHSVATVDLDARQRSLTRYVENRRAWADRVARDLETPEHFCLDHTPDDEVTACKSFTDTVDALAQTHDFIVIDTPGHDGTLTRLAHSVADTLVTPLNDSFVDFDVLATVDPESFAIAGASHYAEMVEEVRRQRHQAGQRATDWIVLRNRLSMLATRNKRLVGAALQELAERLEFRAVDGLAERMIFREFYPRGLTALDDLEETTLGTRPTLSHATARQEVANVINAMQIMAARDPAAESATPRADAA